jgi:iron complex transport system permease protein
LVFWELRLPRALLAGIVGAGLAGAGAFVQGIFRNPLASPEILGVSAGASTGAVSALLLGFSGLWGLGVGAFAGALLVTGLVFLLNSSRPSLTGVLLAGLALSSLLSAISSLLLLLSGEVRLSQYFFWLAGSLQNRRWEHVIFALATVVPALLVLFFRSGRLNLAALGDETAATFGLPVVRFRLISLAWVAFLAAGCVATTGAIGFLGLMIPHALRLLWGEDARYFVPLSALAGAGFLTLADTLARLVVLPFELPVGLLTALLGGPFFIFLLLRTLRRVA